MGKVTQHGSTRVKITVVTVRFDPIWPNYTAFEIVRIISFK